MNDEALNVIRLSITLQRRVWRRNDPLGCKSCVFDSGEVRHDIRCEWSMTLV